MATSSVWPPLTTESVNLRKPGLTAVCLNMSENGATFLTSGVTGSDVHRRFCGSAGIPAPLEVEVDSDAVLAMRLSTDGLHHLARRVQLVWRDGRVPGEVDA